MQKPQKLSKLEEVFRKKKEHNHKYKDKINEATLAYQNFATEVKTKLPVMMKITVNLPHSCQNTEKLTKGKVPGPDVPVGT